MELIDKEKVIKEVKKVYDEGYKFLPSDLVESVDDFKDELLRVLDTLETKDVDLEEEFYDFLDTLIGKDNGHLSEDELFRIAEYFYELGLKAKEGKDL